MVTIRTFASGRAWNRALRRKRDLDFAPTFSWSHGPTLPKFIGHDRCQIFVTPMRGHEVGVAVISRDPQLRFDRAIQQFPFLAEQLCGAKPTTRELGDTTGLRILPAVTKGRIALIGDASGTVDAVTGHGLSLSFQQAISLAESIDQRDLAIIRPRTKKSRPWPSP